MVRYLIIALLIITGCKSESDQVNTIAEYSNVVGDTIYDQNIDGDFKRCDTNSNQYYGINGGFGIKGELSRVKKDIFGNYKPTNKEGQSGFITIRFVVNCDGEAGMYRVHQTNMSLQDFDFDDIIVDQLLAATKNLKAWEIANYQGNTYDYYQYLTYKLLDSKLIDIAP